MLPFLKYYISKTKNRKNREKLIFHSLQNIVQQFGPKNRDGSFWGGRGSAYHILNLEMPDINPEFILIAQIEDLNDDCFKISRPCLLFFTSNKPWKSVTVRVGSGRVGSSF